ncbi:hypothetical protein CkaCkLH20_07352 [Colletotrichum karsti]|uniref:Uncharacterized protein n=1 Tax=Colletotrichum karsti TaxID=1095194 RepID=A0A9P6LJC8_9PEZI|nr:uncharacterized protein CkaCkLH20_07352 [Colletotrichum karsti]KAF9875086.1 hypothetical protein CkaCkLH20_07352 [Colletotrichum karsti]
MPLPSWSQVTAPVRHIRTATFLILTWIITSVLAQEEDYQSPCLSDRFKDPTIQHPGGLFSSNVWLRRGQCIRDVNSYAQCRSNLIAVLDDLSALQSTEYGAGAGVLTLLPTAGALFGSPTAELWALLKMSPIAGFLAQSLTFGATMVPSETEDYLKVSKSQGCTAMRVPPVKKVEEDPSEVTYARVSDEAQQRIRHALKRDRKMPRAYAGLTPKQFFLLGCAVLTVFIAGSQVALAVIEQGAVYSTWCTAIWWAHIWYLVVSVVAIVDGYINLPFDETWKVYISRQNATLIGNESGVFEGSSWELDGVDEMVIEGAMRGAAPKKNAVYAQTGDESQTGRQMLVVISISQEDKRPPIWLSGLRLFFRAGGLTCFVFATSVFAAVTLLALPMSQMVLMVIVGSGFFSRAIVQKMVKTMYHERPVMHLIAEDKQTADRMLTDIMQMKMEPEDASSSYVFEVNGKLWIRQVCVGLTNRWRRRFFGLLSSLPLVEGSGQETKGSWEPLRQTDY